MKHNEKLINALTKIHFNTKKNNVEAKKQWYKVGKSLLNGQKIKMHNESKVGARRTYLYYKENKGDWFGPSPQQLVKIKKLEFEYLLDQRREVSGVTLISEEGNLSRLTPEISDSHVTGHMTNILTESDATGQLMATLMEGLLPN
jgi:hypothetical protein